MSKCFDRIDILSKNKGMKFFDRLFRRKNEAPQIIAPKRISRPDIYADRARWIDGQWASPEEWMQTAMRMLSTDPKISGYASALRHSILSATWTIEPGSDSAEAAIIADRVRDALGLDGHVCHLASGAFESEVEKIVDFALFGRYVVEEIWTQDGEGREWLFGLGDIDQRTIGITIRDPATAVLTGIVQHPLSGVGEVVLPSTKVQIYTFRGQGDETLGVGILRPAYQWWALKNSLIQSLDAGSRRWAIPTPQVSFDRDLLRSLYTDTEIRAFSEQVDEWAEQYMAGETGFVKTPAGINLSLYGGTFDPQRMISAIQTCDQEISSAFLTTWMELGLGEVGSRSVGEIQWNAYKASIGNYLDAIAAVWNGPNRPGGGTIARFLQRNIFGQHEIPPDLMPKLRHRGVSVDAFRDLIGVMPQLVTANLLTPTDDLERRIRREIGINPLSAPERDDRLATAEGQPVSIAPRENQGGRPTSPGPV